jgi:hypothetical protein
MRTLQASQCTMSTFPQAKVNPSHSCLSFAHSWREHRHNETYGVLSYVNGSRLKASADTAARSERISVGLVAWHISYEYRVFNPQIQPPPVSHLCKHTWRCASVLNCNAARAYQHTELAMESEDRLVEGYNALVAAVKESTGGAHVARG